MLVINTKQFKDNPLSYFNKIDQGIEILVKRGKRKSYKIVPLQDDDTLMSKKEFFAKIDRASQSIKEGKGKTVNTKEELIAYLDSL